MRFLLVRLSSLGDVICSLPSASALRDRFPDAEIHWIVDRAFAPLVRACSSVDVVHERPKNLRQAMDFVKGLGRFDAAIDLQGLFKSGWLVGHAVADQKVGYHWQREMSRLFSQPVMPDPTSLHVVDQYVDVVRALGAEPAENRFNMAPSDEALESVKEKLAAAGRDDSRPMVVLNGGAGWATKRWKAENFALVSRSLSEAGMQCAFLGGPTDRPVWEEAKSCDPGPALDMVGQTNMAELVAFVSLAESHVGGDTGSTHLAAALGIKAYGVYTLTKPIRSCPYGQIHRCQTLDSHQLVKQILQERISCP